MEEFIVRNYVYHNLRDLLLKMNKLHPDFLTDEYLQQELEHVRNHINSINFTNSPEPIESLPKVSAELPVVLTEELKVKRVSRKLKTKSEGTVCTGLQAQNNANDAIQPLFTFNTDSTGLQFQVKHSQMPTEQEQVIPSSEKKTKKAPSCVCAARVVSSSRAAMSYDYVSYDATTGTNAIYGRRCKNVIMGDSLFCAVHKKKCEYGIFTDEPSEKVKELCLKKHDRLKEIEEAIEANSIKANMKLPTN